MRAWLLLLFAVLVMGQRDPVLVPEVSQHEVLKVVTLPTAGTLHQSDGVHRSMANAMTGPGDLANFEGTAYFVPAPDGVGFPYSTFTYRFRDTSGLRFGDVF